MLRAFDEANPELVAVSAAVNGAGARSLSLPDRQLRPLCSATNVGRPASLLNSSNVPSADAPVRYKRDNGLRPFDTKQ